jgi:hypothetical protein
MTTELTEMTDHELIAHLAALGDKIEQATSALATKLDETTDA